MAKDYKEWHRLKSEWRAARAELEAVTSVSRRAYRDGVTLPTTLADVNREEVARINLAAARRRFDDFLHKHPGESFEIK